MSTLLLLILPPLAVLAIIIVATIWGTNLLADQFVGQKHRLLEEIMATGEMPTAWTKANQDQPQNSKSRRHILRRLDKLIKYTQTTTFVEDEETRQILLARLNEVRENWVAQDHLSG